MGHHLGDIDDKIQVIHACQYGKINIHRRYQSIWAHWPVWPQVGIKGIITTILGSSVFHDLGPISKIGIYMKKQDDWLHGGRWCAQNFVNIFLFQQPVTWWWKNCQWSPTICES